MRTHASPRWALRTRVFTAAVALVATACASTVGAGSSDGSTSGPWVESPSCATVRASCGAAPMQFVRGHAEGLTGLEGARARFTMRVVPPAAEGIAGPRTVLNATSVVRGGAFEACLCLPYGGSVYPELAAVLFTPGTSDETGRSVARALYSQRYATLGDEDLSALTEPAPSRGTVEAALAAATERTVTLRVRGLAGEPSRTAVLGGLVSDERPVAAQVVSAAVDGDARVFTFAMPGRASPDERLVIVLARTADRRCSAGDATASLALDGRSVLEVTPAMLRDASETPALCEALAIDAPRGG